MVTKARVAGKNPADCGGNPGKRSVVLRVREAWVRWQKHIFFGNESWARARGWALAVGSYVGPDLGSNLEMDSHLAAVWHAA